jgi:hypothetical protein
MVYDEIIFLYIILAIMTTIIFNNSNQKVFIGLLLILIAMQLHLKINPIFLLLIAIIGSVTEMIIMKYSHGIWNYRNPNFINIPIWLPLLWAIAGSGVLFVANFVDRIENLINKKLI